MADFKSVFKGRRVCALEVVVVVKWWGPGAVSTVSLDIGILRSSWGFGGAQAKHPTALSVGVSRSTGLLTLFKSTESKSDTFKGGQGILRSRGSRGQADYGGLQPGDIPSSPQTCLQLGPHRMLLLRLRLYCFMQWTHIFCFSYWFFPV